MSADKRITAVLLEWWTGLTAKGAESAFARWSKVADMRARTMDVADLGAMLSTALPSESLVRVRLAAGADGATDVRVELEDPKGVSVLRWRPAPDEKHNLDDVLEHGTTRARRGAGLASFAKRVARALKADVERFELADTHDAISALKFACVDLTDRAEAGDKDSAVQLDAIRQRIATIRERHDALNVARKLAAAELEASQ